MIVNFPRSLRHETFESPSFYENHLLEKVSMLEQQLSQMTEIMQTALKIIREQTQLAREDRQVARLLFDSINLQMTENSRASVESVEPAVIDSERIDFRVLIEQIGKNSNSQNPAIFEQLFKDALKSFENTEEKQAFLYLERAQTLDAENSALILFFALRLFLADKFERALEKLQASEKTAADNPGIEFLQGIILADAGKFAAANKIFKKAETVNSESFAFNYTRGFVFAALGKWNNAVNFWERAAVIRAAPEIFYLIGCAFYQIGNFQKSFDEIQKATAGDEQFADAHFMQCLILNELNRPAEAEKSLQNALSHSGGESQFVEQYRKFQLQPLTVALPFRHFAAKKRILTGGSQRLRKLFRAAVARDLQI